MPNLTFHSIALAGTLTLCGTAAMLLPMIASLPVSVRAATKGFFPITLFTSPMAFAAFALLGVGVATRLVRVCDRRFVGAALAISMLALAFADRLCLQKLRKEPVASPAAAVIVTGAAIAVVTAAALALTIWFGRSSGRIKPLVMLAYFFFGCLLGLLAYPIWLEPMLTIDARVDVGAGFLVATGFATFATCGRSIAGLSEEQAPSPRPTWRRRLRWFLFGGLPGCVMVGAVGYVETELSPTPIFWLIIYAFGIVTWVVAFARGAAPTNFAGWIAQCLAAATMTAIAVVAGVAFYGKGDELEVAVAATTTLMLGAALLPLPATLIAQAGLLALTLALLYPPGSFRPLDSLGFLPVLITHLLSCVIICRGCHGDAVADAPTIDRLPELLLWLLGGFVVCGLAFQILPPLVLPSSWGTVEYPFAIAASFMVRFDARRSVSMEA